MLTLHGQVKDGRLTYQPPNDELYTRWLSDCEGKSVKVRLSRVGPQKTRKQLGAYFGLAVMMIRQAMVEHGWDICGIAPNKQMIHEILLKCCGGVGPGGEMKRLSEMTIDEACVFFDNVRTWAVTQLGINVPDPDPTWRDRQN